MAQQTALLARLGADANNWTWTTSTTERWTSLVDLMTSVAYLDKIWQPWNRV